MDGEDGPPGGRPLNRVSGLKKKADKPEEKKNETSTLPAISSLVDAIGVPPDETEEEVRSNVVGVAPKGRKSMVKEGRRAAGGRLGGGRRLGQGGPKSVSLLEPETEPKKEELPVRRKFASNTMKHCKPE